MREVEVLSTPEREAHTEENGEKDRERDYGEGESLGRPPKHPIFSCTL